MSPSRRQAGFTLIELMIVVSIIGISLLAFGPSFTQAMADRRAATASMELVRIGRRARAESIGLQRAMLVFIQYGSRANNTARLRLLRGNGIRCDIENWPVRAAQCPIDDTERNESECMESIDLSSSHWFHAPYAITVGVWRANETPNRPTPAEVVMEVANGSRSGFVGVCYEPSGVVRWSTTDLFVGSLMGFSQLNAADAAGGGLMFVTGMVNRNAPITLVNVPRVALFPLGTSPRRLR